MTPAEFGLVFAADDGFAWGLAVAMGSALGTLAPGCRPEVYVLDNGLSESSRVRLLRIAERVGRAGDVRWIQVPTERLASVPTPVRLPAASYARLLIPELVAPHIRRAVYLDSDVLVRRDLSPLFTLELGDAVIAAARDLAIRTVEYERLKLPAHDLPRPYYNGGVLVIDVPGWRDTRLGDRALEFASRAVLKYAEQDALNAVVESWCTLEDRWNVQSGSIALAKRRLFTDWRGYRSDRDLYRAAAVVHLLGPGPKPWEPRSETLGTVSWAFAFARSDWHTGAAGLPWLVRWFVIRAALWPAITTKRWRARMVAARRSARSPRDRI
jgi:lipopolysaccharide biosynthesis glycosyltransferase